MLCATCVSIFQKPKRQGWHHRNSSHLREAAVQGCRICLHLIQRLEALTLAEGRTAAVSEIRYEFHYDRYLLNWSLQFHADVEGEDYEFFAEARLRHEPDRALPELYSQYIHDVTSDLDHQPYRVRDDGFPRDSIARNTGALSVAAIGRNWLDECTTAHPKCYRDLDARGSMLAWQPKRLVDCRSSDMLHLVVRDYENINVPYATLSHCWGPNPSFFQLTVENLLHVLDGIIPISDLPQSFRDAIMICQRLDIRYLWIDSVCIIQSGDDGSDWRMHASEMRLVYSNCLLNIAIEHATNPHQGAFSDRDPNILQPCHVFWLHGSGGEMLPSAIRGYGEPPSPESAHAESGSKVYTVYLVDIDFQRVLSSSRLSERGWVLQERFLARRVLHLTDERIFWECSTLGTMIEYLFRLDPEQAKQTSEFDSTWWIPFSLAETPWPTSPLAAKNRLKITEWWCSIVEKYSRSKFSFPDKDWLVALGGVAQALNGRLCETYLAGVFWGDLPVSLLWERAPQPEDPLHTRTAVDIAPSWSWAAVKQEVYFSQLDHHEIRSITTLVDVLDAVVEPVDEQNVYGQVKYGSLCVRGFRVPFDWIDKGNPLDQRENEIFIPCLGKVAQTVFDWHHPLEKQDLSLLLIASISASDADGQESKRSEGLMLQKGRDDGTYRRVGIFKCSGIDLSGYREVTSDGLRGIEESVLTIV
ncbi:heterokaryon incompatibility protein-domain-containing protein [Xylariaceae sp. FL0016]|nr:heterokaryon incompatibility protein-domain-containing protein [Xylariaceae sp. FL0016]